MYIVRWLMGHPILATWFLGAIAILLSIGNNSGHKEESHATKEEQVKSVDSTKTLETPSAVTSALIESDANKVKDASQAQDIKSQDVEKVEAVKNEVKTDSSTSETEAKAVVASEGNAVKAESESSEKSKSTEQIQEATANKTGTQADMAVTASQPTETIIETPKPVEGASDTASIQDLGQSSTEEMLLMAREAYWNNGLDEASQIYTQLIELEPTVIEHRGELGNVYWRQGYPEKAAELYSEIAIPMIEQGNSERVANMIGFIGLFYPDRAAEIHKRLQAATH